MDMPGRHADHDLLGDARVYEALRIFLAELLERACGRDVSDDRG
jgi:hypothetical protein